MLLYFDLTLLYHGDPSRQEHVKSKLELLVCVKNSQSTQKRAQAQTKAMATRHVKRPRASEAAQPEAAAIDTAADDAVNAATPIAVQLPQRLTCGRC